MLAQLSFYIVTQLFVLPNSHCHAKPLQGEHVELAKKGEFPFVVSFNDACNLKKENHICGGTLISNEHVLTAAHCMVDDMSCVRAVINSIDFESGVIRDVEAYITYDEWAMQNNVIPQYKYNDVAIVKLSRVVNVIQPAKISALTRDQVIGQSIVTAGWGDLNDSALSAPDILRKANLKVLSAVEFQRREMKLANWTGPMPTNVYFTAADPPIFITHGDSGSPLLLASNNEIVGINAASYSFPKGKPNPYRMAQHFSIDYYRDFIDAFVMNYK